MNEENQQPEAEEQTVSVEFEEQDGEDVAEVGPDQHGAEQPGGTREHRQRPLRAQVALLAQVGQAVAVRRDDGRLRAGVEETHHQAQQEGDQGDAGRSHHVSASSWRLPAAAGSGSRGAISSTLTLRPTMRRTRKRYPP